MDCLFCRIAAGSEESALVYQDEHCFAFMDIHPLGQGHVLLIPRQHVEKLDQLPATTRSHLYRVFDELLAAQRRAGFGAEGSHLLVNDGKASNQHVPHAHLHLIPRKRGDALGFAWRLLLHFTGLFGPRTGLDTLRSQADAIARHIEQPARPQTTPAPEPVR